MLRRINKGGTGPGFSSKSIVTITIAVSILTGLLSCRNVSRKVDPRMERQESDYRRFISESELARFDNSSNKRFEIKSDCVGEILSRAIVHTRRKQPKTKGRILGAIEFMTPKREPLLKAWIFEQPRWVAINHDYYELTALELDNIRECLQIP